jgi:4-hydroxybenzoate polyprenyltransferase/phosphoserine phosphatase
MMAFVQLFRADPAETAGSTPAVPPVLDLDRSFVLVLDLDGTLTPVDTLHEAVLQLHRVPPVALWGVVRSLRAGKAAFKRSVAGVVALEHDLLPLRSDLVDWLSAEHAAGRRIVLVSAADQAIVDALARRLPFAVDAAIGSDGLANLSGEAKLARIRALVGPDFVYAGDAAVDLPIWQAAKGAVLVGGGLRFAHRIGQVPVLARFPHPERALPSWIRALRVYQWPKNLLVFLPVLLAGPLASGWDWVEAVLAVAMLCLLASAGYMANDLLDLSADRRHPVKRRRPFASGALPVAHGVLAIPILFGSAMLIGLALPLASTVLGLCYLAGTLTYSMVLKKIPILDTIVLACLFTLRVVGGIVLLALPWSFWLLTFSMFFFLSLALVKRFTELREVSLKPERSMSRRGYTVEELPLLLALGTGTAIASTVIFVVYLIEEQFSRSIYATPEWLWVIFVLLLFWLGRVWQLAVRGQMNEDPLIFALKDRLSHLMGAAIVVIILLARNA